MKKSILLYQDQKEVFDTLTDEQAGKLIKAIFQYQENGESILDDSLLKIIMIPIRQAIDRNNEKSNLAENHWNWKGGISNENHKVRNSSEMKEWRKEVFKRDNYTCQKCNKVSGKLNAHHIKPFSIYPKLRFVLSNGITLCKGCHIELHKTDRHW